MRLSGELSELFPLLVSGSSWRLWLFLHLRISTSLAASFQNHKLWDAWNPPASFPNDFRTLPVWKSRWSAPLRCTCGGRLCQLEVVRCPLVRFWDSRFANQEKQWSIWELLKQESLRCMHIPLPKIGSRCVLSAILFTACWNFLFGFTQIRKIKYTRHFWIIKKRAQKFLLTIEQWQAWRLISSNHASSLCQH